MASATVKLFPEDIFSSCSNTPNRLQQPYKYVQIRET